MLYDIYLHVAITAPKTNKMTRNSVNEHLRFCRQNSHFSFLLIFFSRCVLDASRSANRIESCDEIVRVYVTCGWNVCPASKNYPFNQSISQWAVCFCIWVCKDDITHEKHYVWYRLKILFFIYIYIYFIRHWTWFPWKQIRKELFNW